MWPPAGGGGSFEAVPLSSPFSSSSSSSYSFDQISIDLPSSSPPASSASPSRPRSSSAHLRPLSLLFSNVVLAFSRSLLLTLVSVKNVFGFSLLVAISTSASSSSSTFSLSFKDIYSITLNAVLTTCPLLFLLLNSNYPGCNPVPDVFMLPFLTELASAVAASVAASPSCNSSSQVIPTILACAGTTSLALSLLIYLTTAKKLLPRKLHKLLNFGQFIPYPVICGTMSSVAVFFLKMAALFVTQSDLKTVLTTEPRKLLVVLLSALPSLVARKLESRGDRPDAFVYVLGATAAVPLLLAVTGVVDRETSFLFLSPSLFSSASSSSSSEPLTPFHTVLRVRPSDVCGPAYVQALPAVLTTVVVYLMRFSLQVPSFTKSLTAYLGKTLHGKTFHATPRISRATSLSLFLSPFLTSVFPVILNAGELQLYCQYGALGPGPYFFHIATLAAISYAKPDALLFVSTLCFSTLAFTMAGKLLVSWFARPYQFLTRLEFASVISFVVLAELFGMLASFGVASAICTLSFINGFVNAGAIKFIGSGLNLRSSVDRQVGEAKVLDEYSDRVQIVCLQSYLFFGNAIPISNYISTMFQDSGNQSPDLPPLPRVVLFDFGLVAGIDFAAIECLQNTVSLCRGHGCDVILSSVPAAIGQLLERTGLTEEKQSNFCLKADFDAALAAAEDTVLEFVGDFSKPEFRSDERVARRQQTMAATAGGAAGRNSPAGIIVGFCHAMDLHAVNFGVKSEVVAKLKELADLVSPIDLSPGEGVYDVLENKLGLLHKGSGEGGGGGGGGGGEEEDNEGSRGLFFVEYGLIRVEPDPAAEGSTMSHASSLKQRYQGHNGGAIRGNAETLTGLNARSSRQGRVASGAKEQQRRQKGSVAFNIASRGPGSTIGGREVASGLRACGVYLAVIESRLYYLPQREIDRLEGANPALAIALHKTISTGLASSLDSSFRQTQQLSELMNSRDIVRPKSRKVVARVNAALKRMNIG